MISPFILSYRLYRKDEENNKCDLQSLFFRQIEKVVLQIGWMVFLSSIIISLFYHVITTYWLIISVKLSTFLKTTMTVFLGNEVSLLEC